MVAGQYYIDPPYHFQTVGASLESGVTVVCRRHWVVSPRSLLRGRKDTDPHRSVLSLSRKTSRGLRWCLASWGLAQCSTSQHCGWWPRYPGCDCNHCCSLWWDGRIAVMTYRWLINIETNTGYSFNLGIKVSVWLDVTMTHDIFNRMVWPSLIGTVI